ncbi:hypothetical protein NQ315_008983, partial [Exocentrus adspersus]
MEFHRVNVKYEITRDIKCEKSRIGKVGIARDAEKAKGRTPFRDAASCYSSRHFTVCSYLNRATGRLCANAVPTLLPASSVGQQSPSEQTVSTVTHLARDQEVEVPDKLPVAGCGSCNAEGNLVQLSSPVATTSVQLETPSTPPRSIFRGIKGLSAADTTPRKQHLMNLVKSKEAHIRKLKKLCRKKTGDIKSLTNIGDSTVVRNVFRGMSSVTTDFLISQLRCAKKSPRGRRWTTQDKVLALALFKKSPKCYRLLRKIVALPSKNTLLAMLQK